MTAVTVTLQQRGLQSFIFYYKYHSILLSFMTHQMLSTGRKRAKTWEHCAW
jgi:hypothetical protein